eukprot:4861540-Prymnesium_polylepis.1
MSRPAAPEPRDGCVHSTQLLPPDTSSPLRCDLLPPPWDAARRRAACARVAARSPPSASPCEVCPDLQYQNLFALCGWRVAERRARPPACDDMCRMRRIALFAPCRHVYRVRAFVCA